MKKKLFKDKKSPPKVFLLVLFLVFSFFFWISRLWRFEDLMTFHLDQALFMREIWEMITTGKLRLVGPMVTSKIVIGRGFFIGPAFYYILTPLAIIFNWNVVYITKFLVLVWWLTALGIFVWISRRFSWLTGLAAYGIFAGFPFLIDYSRLIWNPNFLPLISLGFFWLLGEIWRKEKIWHWFLLGFFFGLGINFHYSAVLWIGFFLLFLILGILRKKFEFLFFGLPLFILGAILGDFPILVFELRHNFYNLKTILFFYFKEGFLKGKGGVSLGGYFLFSLIPVFFWIFSYFIYLFEKTFGWKKVVILVLAIFIFLVSKINWHQRWGAGMPEGWNVEKQKLVADWICKDVKKEKTDGRFEIAATISGDTRAGDLRWWLWREGCTPLGVEDYPKADVLYLVAPQKRIPENEVVWEVRAMKPFLIAEIRSLDDGIMLYKLVK